MKYVGLFFIFFSLGNSVVAQTSNADSKAKEILYQMGFEASSVEGEIYMQKIAKHLDYQVQKSEKSKKAGSSVKTIIKNYNPRNTGTNGLTGEFVRFIYEASNGDLYFSNRGMDIWDGVNWEYLSPGDGNFPTTNIYDMLEDRKGNLWFATYSGLVRWDKKTEETFVYTPDNSDITTTYNKRIFEAPDGTIYVGHLWNDELGGGITKFDSNGNIIGRISGETGLYGDSIESMVMDSEGNLWVATGADPETGEYGGVNKINVSTGEIVFYNMDNSDLPTNELSSLAFDANGNLWAGLYTNDDIDHTIGGLVKFDGTTWTHYSQNNGDNVGSNIQALSIDSQGKLWIGAYEGLYTYDGTSFEKITETDDGYEIKNIADITELSDGRIAVSRYYDNQMGGGASFYDPSTYSWEHMSTRDGGVNSVVNFGAAEDNKGNLWVTGFYGVQKFDGENWTLYTEKDGLAYTYAWDLIVDRQDNVWLTGSANGISRINADGTIDAFYENGAFGESLYEDSNGGIWIGDYGERAEDESWLTTGLMYYDGSTFKVFDSSNGLPVAPMLSIIEDLDNNIIVASWDGIYRLEGEIFSKWEFNGYTDGAEQLLKDSQNRLWIARNDDILTMFDGTNWYEFGPSDGIDGYVTDMEEDLNGRVWVANMDGAAFYEHGAWNIVSGKDGVPNAVYNNNTSIIYDIAPSQTTSGKVSFGSYYAGVITMETELSVAISDIQDYPNDQGGWIKVTADGYLLSQNYSGKPASFWMVQVKNADGNWETASSLSPISSKTISVQVPVTKASDEEVTAANSFVFRIAAFSDENTILGYSDEATGYAEDNIAPSAVEYFKAQKTGNLISLEWDAVDANDIDGYAIYIAGVTDFAGTTPLVYSTSTQAQVSDENYSELIIVAKDIHNNYGTASQAVVGTGIEILTETPDHFALNQNYPNPFNPSTKISYSLPQSGLVTLSVYNTLGQRVKVLVNEVQSAGSYDFNFDAKSLPSGLYIYRLQSGNFTETLKMTLLK